MKNRGLCIAVGIVCFYGGELQAKALLARSEDQFQRLAEEAPMSVVIFINSSEGPRSTKVIAEKVSRDQRYKDAGLQFIVLDANRAYLTDLVEQYTVDCELPYVQIFLRDRQKPKAFIKGAFTQEELKSFIERYIGREITNEINSRKLRKQFALAQAKRPYYAADYYNPFYMMPWYNYSPPSDWPDQGPEWVGIEID